LGERSSPAFLAGAILFDAMEIINRRIMKNNERILRCYVELGIMWSRFCTFQWVRCEAAELLNIIAGGDGRK
jgi:hypothetical protein